MIMEILGYAAMVCVGLILGCIGSGGSILAIPILVYMFSEDVEVASGYSLFLVGVTSLTGAMLKHGEQNLNVRAAILFGLPSIASAFVARRWLMPNVPEKIWDAAYLEVTKDHLLLLLLSSLMIGSACLMLTDASKKFVISTMKPAWLIPAGLMVGFISGFVGIGGGFLIFPVMILLAGLSVHTAVGTTLLVIAFNSLFGFCGHIFTHSINWYFLLSLTAFALIGLILGVWAEKKINPPSSTSKLFAWFTIATGLWMVLNELIA